MTHDTGDRQRDIILCHEDEIRELRSQLAAQSIALEAARKALIQSRDMHGKWAASHPAVVEAIRKIDKDTGR